MSAVDSFPAGPTHVGEWVPVDRRWLGLDRRTIVPAVVVLAVAVVMILVIPAIDRAVPAGSVIPAGARIGLIGNVEFVPAPGWTLVDGALVGDTSRAGRYPETAEVVDGAASLTVTSANYAGTPAQLLAQVESIAERSGSRAQFSGVAQPVRTTSGVSGVQTEVRTATSAGLIAAFVVDGQGIEVSAGAPTQAGRGVAADVGAMVLSIATIESR